MKKLEAAVLALSAVSLAGMLFAVSEARNSTSGISALSDRVAKIESATPAVRPAAGPSNAELARDIAALRVQVSSLASRQPPPGTDPVAKPPLAPSGATTAEMEAAAEAEKRQQEWLESLSAGIIDNLTETLDLSAQQRSQVSDLVQVQIGSFRQARLGKTGEDAKNAVDEVYADTNAKMRLLLTSEQQAKFDEIANKPGGIFTVGIAPQKLRHPDPPNGRVLDPK